MLKRRRKRPVAMQRKRYFDLTPGIRRQIREIRKSLRGIEQSIYWSTCVEGNKAFARMCADLIVTDAHVLYREFKEAGIGFRNGVPLILTRPEVSNDQA